MMMQYIKTNDVGVFNGSFCFDWSVEPGILLLQPRGWNGTGNGTFLSIKSILRCSFFPQILKTLSTWLAFGQGQRISDCHSPSSHIQDLVRPFSTPGFIRDFKQALPKMLLTTPRPLPPSNGHHRALIADPIFSFLIDAKTLETQTRCTFFQQWVYASNIQLWGLWNRTLSCLFFDITRLC